VQAKRDTESIIFSKFWIPACAGMTILFVIHILRHIVAGGNDKKDKRQRRAVDVCDNVTAEREGGASIVLTEANTG